MVKKVETFQQVRKIKLCLPKCVDVEKFVEKRHRYDRYFIVKNFCYRRADRETLPRALL